MLTHSWCYFAEGPPVPIPNTEVKLCRGDNTYLETGREDSSSPTFSSRFVPESAFLLFLLSSVGRANISLCTNELVGKTHKFGTDFCAVSPHSSLAQSVEHLTVNQGVTGSSPVGGANNTSKIVVFGVFSSVKTKN